MILSTRFLTCAVLLLSSLSLAASLPGKPSGSRDDYPGLLEATTEELARGLRRGLFTSVDLVNVSFILVMWITILKT